MTSDEVEIEDGDAEGEEILTEQQNISLSNSLNFQKPIEKDFLITDSNLTEKQIADIRESLAIKVS